MLLQFIVIVIYAYGGNKLYFTLYDTEDSIIITSSQRSLNEVIKGIRKYKLQYNISKIADYRDKNFLNKIISSVSSLEKIRVNLDSQEFEKYFDVYSTDKIIAMQLLTADIMQLLINFKKEMKMYYEITIKNNSIYIRFRTGKMFEPVSVFGFSLDKKIIYKYYKILDFVFSLTDNLINLIKETEY